MAHIVAAGEYVSTLALATAVCVQVAFLEIAVTRTLVRMFQNGTLICSQLFIFSSPKCNKSLFLKFINTLLLIKSLNLHLLLTNFAYCLV